MIESPMNRMFISPKNKAEFFLTDTSCQGKIDTVKPRESTICSNRILPDARAELRGGDARKAPRGPHNSALVSGCFFARHAQEGRLL